MRIPRWIKRGWSWLGPIGKVKLLISLATSGFVTSAIASVSGFVWGMHPVLRWVAIVSFGLLVWAGVLAGLRLLGDLVRAIAGQAEIDRAIARLDSDCLQLMTWYGKGQVFGPFQGKGWAAGGLPYEEARVRVDKMQQLGIVEMSPDAGTYQWTVLGRSVIGKLDPKLQEIREELEKGRG